MCRSLPSTSARANAVSTSPRHPLPIQRFSPLSSHEPSLCCTARVSML
jgi:ureidoglycolate hydrolase